MNPAPQLIVHADADLLAAATACRLITRLVDLQASGRTPNVALTGGRGGTSVLAAAAASPARDSVNWAQVDFWWSDERFLPLGDPERNETSARDALLDHVSVDPARVHPMPRSDGPDDHDLDRAARSYAVELRRAAEPSLDLPHLDLCLLGIGEDAHVASLFPARTEAYDPVTITAVHDSPKPPPLRTTFTMSTIRSAAEVWLIAAGAGKAEAVRRTLADLPEKAAPAGSARGQIRTLLLADSAAAASV